MTPACVEPPGVASRRHPASRKPARRVGISRFFQSGSGRAPGEFIGRRRRASKPAVAQVTSHQAPRLTSGAGRRQQRFFWHGVFPSWLVSYRPVFVEFGPIPTFSSPGSSGATGFVGPAQFFAVATALASGLRGRNLPASEPPGSC